MGHKDYTYRGWKISMITGFVDQHWSSSFSIRKPEKIGASAQSGHAIGSTEDEALHKALAAARRWVDNREGDTKP